MLEVSTPYGVQVLKTGKCVPGARGWSRTVGKWAPLVLADWRSEPLLSLGCCYWVFSLVTGSLLSCFAEFFLDSVSGSDTSLLLNHEVPCSWFCLSQPVAATGAYRWWSHAPGALLEQFLGSEQRRQPSVAARDGPRNPSASFLIAVHHNPQQQRQSKTIRLMLMPLTSLNRLGLSFCSVPLPNSKKKVTFSQKSISCKVVHGNFSR